MPTPRRPRAAGPFATLVAAGLALSAALPPAPAFAQDDARTLRVVMGNELAGLDPVASTATFARNHGFMVYDQLYGLDSQGRPRPQMVERAEASPDRMSWRFTLREGLAFHDGTPVRAADAVASIRRWAQRDVVGRALAAATASLEAVDDKTFELRLSRPFALVLEALARPTGSALFVMPERVAQTPGTTAITDTTGSGPFLFPRERWRIGDRAVYLRNPNYRPRDEAPDGLAGGKVVKVDRLEWRFIPDPATASAALASGEVDYWELPPPDLMPSLARNRAIRIVPVNPVGSMVWIRMNHAQPPFNDPRARQALLHLVSQRDVLDAAGIPPADRVDWCPAYFLCGTPLESRAGSAGFEEPNVERARALLREAGYDGRRIVFLDPVELNTNHAATAVLAEAFRKAGLNVDPVAMDFATMSVRRNKREPVEEGGWNLFVTVANSLDAGDPLVNLYLATPCQGGLAGWPCDERMEQLRRAWWEENDEGKRRALVDQIQERAYAVVPYINGGQYRFQAAVRSNVEGVRPTTVPVFWGVEKR